VTRPAQLLASLSGAAARRPIATLLVLAALGAGGAGLVLGLHPTAATDTLVGRSSETYRATQRYYAQFGEEPLEILVQGDLRRLLLSGDVDRLAGLEGCLSGNLPPAALPVAGGAEGPCAQLARAHTVKVVLGPGTFVNEAALQINRSLRARQAQAQRAAAQARTTVYRAALARGLGAERAAKLASEAARATLAGFAAEVSALAIRYGLTSTPSIEDRSFVSTLVFDSSKPAGTPKQRFAYLFPSPNAAVISMRLRARSSDAQRAHTIALVRQALAMPQWRLQNGGSYRLTGEPVIASQLESSISHSIELLALAVLGVMALLLGLVSGGRPRMLPLAIALLTAALAFGALSAVGGSLTMASIAALPVLVGLAVDYAIQFQSGSSPRAIAVAALACMGGLAVLAISPVPMVRGFGLLLIVGLAIAFLCALTGCSAAQALDGRTRARELGGSLGSAWQGAREILAENPLTRAIRTLGLQHAVERPGRVLAVALALAALGWGLDTQTPVQTDIAKLVPQSMQSLSNLHALEGASGVGGELDLMVSSSSLTKPSTVEWMSAYESAMLHRFGYSPTRGCTHAQLCPAFSLPDLFQAGTGGGGAGGGGTSGGVAGGRLTQAQVSGLLKAVPAYFAQAVIGPDHRTAALSFGLRLMPLQQQQRLIAQLRSSLHPPSGVHAQLVGLSVLAAQSGAQVASTGRRMLMLLAALGAVALLLLALFRGELRRALVPLVPIALATGWSALALFLTRVPLNPMSVTLGALVIAVSTEFSVLLCERHRQEMLAGRGVVEALGCAYRRTGAAIAASGVTAIAGFGVLTLSDIAMLRDFGVVTLIDLSVSLVGVLVVLPAALVLAEGRERRWARATGATSPSLG
jgi:predicted RND superfamily exporter protein